MWGLTRDKSCHIILSCQLGRINSNYREDALVAQARFVPGRSGSQVSDLRAEYDLPENSRAVVRGDEVDDDHQLSRKGPICFIQSTEGEDEGNG